MRQSISKSVAQSKRKRVDERDDGFYEDLLAPRSVNTAESWAAYHFERHARKCAWCYNPYEVHRNHEKLCDTGHGLAQQLARYMYQGSDGLIYSTTEKDNKPARIEVPAGYVEVCGLMKAVERSKRHRSRRPFVSMDRSHNTSPRANLGVPAGRASPVPAPDSEVPLPLSKTSRTNPGIIAEMTLAEPSGSQMLAEHSREFKEGIYADSASEGSVSESNSLFGFPLSTGAVYPSSFRASIQASFDAQETRDSLSEDSDADADLSRSTGSEIQDGLGAQETIQNMGPWGSDYIIPPNQNDDLSVASSDEGSVFSVSSLASSATDLSKRSGYSAVQIATATRELLSIFRDDKVLQPLYTTAIHGVIGPQKFVNKFRRLLKAFAERLKDEAQDRLDFLAARLVALKAREIANAVLERYQLGKAPDLDVGEGRGDSALERDDRDSSDEDEQEETNVDETVFEELTNVRDFLVHSAAFKSLQADLQQFVTSKRRSKKHSKKPAIEQQDDPNPEEGTYRIYLDASPQSAEFAIENDCFDMLKHDRPLLELYLYVFCALGIDRFVDEYSELLRYHCTNAHALVQNKVNDWMSGSVDKQPITIWQVIASAVALHLESADANLSYEKNQRCGASADTSFLLELLSREREALDWPAPYHHLNRDLALLTLRGPLRQLLPHIPKRAMELSSRNDTSFVNTTKAFLEDYTMTEWDWWPLAPRVPDVKYGESRLQWKFGGTRLYETLSSLECNIIRFAMPSLPDHPKQCSCCHIESPGKTSSAASRPPVNRTTEPQPSQWCLSLPMTWIKAAAGTAASSSNSSTASQRYTPTKPSATSITGTNSAAAGGTSTNLSAINNSNSIPQIAGQPATNPSIVLPDPSLRVLFGVQGSRWSLEVEQISTALLNDPAFFRELKTRYKKHRSWIKRLTSPFRFHFCRFVKLEKFDTGRVLSQGDDLPDYPGVRDDYEYAPKPGTIPMISPKIFAVCLKACNMNCKWPWINPWHDCVSLPCRSYRLGCIPKKKSEFDIQSDDAITVAWGLEADHAISFAFMAVYHLVPLLAAFSFWIYWLIKFPGDWQNAAVPVLTVLAIFAVLWVPFGKHLGIV